MTQVPDLKKETHTQAHTPAAPPAPQPPGAAVSSQDTTSSITEGTAWVGEGGNQGGKCHAALA